MCQKIIKRRRKCFKQLLRQNLGLFVVQIWNGPKLFFPCVVYVASDGQKLNGNHMTYNKQQYSILQYKDDNEIAESRSGNHKEKKIHRLAHRFSIDFKIYSLAYGFLCVNHKGLLKVYRFLVRAFFSQDLKNP